MNTDEINPQLLPRTAQFGLTGRKVLSPAACYLWRINIPRRNRKNHEASWCQLLSVHLRGLVWPTA